MRAKLLTLATIPLLMACAACGEKIRIALPPAELETCADEAEAPDLPAMPWADALKALTGADALAILKPIAQARDAATLDYVLAQRSAYGDCRSKVDGLKAWRETAAK